MYIAMVQMLVVLVLCCFQFQGFTSAQGLHGCSYAYLEHPVETLSCNPYPNGLLKLRCKVVGPLNVHMSISWFWEDAGGIVRELGRSSKYNIQNQENFGVTGDLELGERRFSLLNVASLSDSDAGFYFCQIRLRLANEPVVFLKPSNRMKVHPKSLYQSLNYQTCSNEAQTTMESSCADLNNAQVLEQLTITSTLSPEHQIPYTTHTTFTASILSHSSSHSRIHPTITFATIRERHTGIMYQKLQPTSKHLAHTDTRSNHRSLTVLTMTTMSTEFDPPVEPSVSTDSEEILLYVLVPGILVLTVTISILSVVTVFNIQKKRKERTCKKGICKPVYPQLPVSAPHCSQHQPNTEESGDYIDITAVSPVNNLKGSCTKEEASIMSTRKLDDHYKQLDVSSMDYTDVYVSARLQGRVHMLEGGKEYAVINTRGRDPASMYATARIMYQQGELN